MSAQTHLEEKLAYLNTFKAVFFDMDGTLAQTTLYPLEVCEQGEVYLHFRPLHTTVEALRRVQVPKYILSVSPSDAADASKKVWLAQHCADIQLEDVFLIRDNKAGFMEQLAAKLGLSPAEMILVDDQNVVLHDVLAHGFAAMQMSELVY